MENKPAFNFVDLTLLFAILVWALNFTVIKASLEAIGPHTFNALRFILAATLLWWVIWKRGDWFKLRKTDIIPLLTIGILGNLLYQYLFIVGINYTLAANAAIMLGTIPIWVALVSHFFSDEKMTRLRAFGVLFAFAGVVLIITGGDNPVSFESDTFLGDMLIIGAAMVFGFYTLYSKRYLATYSPLQFSGMMVAIGAVGLTLIAIPEMSQTSWADITLAAYGGMVYSGALAIGLAYLIWNNGLVKVGIVRTATYQNLVPVLGLIFGVILLNEQLNLLQYTGSAIAVAGIVLTRMT